MTKGAPLQSEVCESVLQAVNTHSLSSTRLRKEAIFIALVLVLNASASSAAKRSRLPPKHQNFRERALRPEGAKGLARFQPWVLAMQKCALKVARE